VEVGEGLVVVEDGAEFLDAGNGFIALEVEHLPGGAETEVQAFLFGGSLAVGEFAGDSGGGHSFEVGLHTTNGFLGIHDDLTANVL